MSDGGPGAQTAARPVATAPRLRLTGVGVDVDGATVLDGVDWEVAAGQHWVVLGPNGSGKSTLVRVAGLWGHPSRGTVDVLGHRLGRVDVRTLRRRVGWAAAAMADQLRTDLTAHEVVLTGARGALEPWWHHYDDDEHRRADAALDRVGGGHLRDRRFGVLSSGERQRVLLARALADDPALVLLDEPTAALDLAGREGLVTTLGRLAADPASAAMVLVTHHVEEIPPGFTHVLMLSAGRVLAAGPLEATLTDETLSACAGLAVSVRRERDRWSATAG